MLAWPRDVRRWLNSSKFNGLLSVVRRQLRSLLHVSLQTAVRAQRDGFCSGDGLVPLGYSLAHFSVSFSFKSLVFIFSFLLISAVRIGLHRATARLSVHQFLIKFELKILFPLG